VDEIGDEWNTAPAFVPSTVWGVALIPDLAVESRRPPVFNHGSVLPCIVAPCQLKRWCASPASQLAYACSAVKRWLLAMPAHGCGAAGARLTASARSGLLSAGRDAGTGAPTEHRNYHWKKKKVGGNCRGLAPAAMFTRFLTAIYTP
jgi:hypothetical protein